MVLSDNSIGDEGAKAMAQQLHHCPQLQHLDLSCNKIADEGAKNLAEQLHQCPQLTEMVLSNNSIGDEGGKAIAQQLLHHPMATLRVYLVANKVFCRDVNFWIYFLLSTEIKSIHLGAKAFSLIPRPSLRCCHSQVQQLEELVILGSPSPVRQSFILSQLRELSALRELTLVLDSGAELIMELFKASDAEASSGRQLHLRKLEELDLRRNDLGPAEARVIAEAVLPQCPQLQRLNLSINKLHNEGAMAIAEQLHHCPRLQILDLRHNGINDEGAKEAVRAAVRAHCPAMRDLRL